MIVTEFWLLTGNLPLKNGGVFCGQFFGNRDQRKNNTHRTFHTKEQALELLKGLEVLSFEEEEKLKTKKKWKLTPVSTSTPNSSSRQAGIVFF